MVTMVLVHLVEKSSLRVKGTGGCEATTTYFCLELWQVPRHKLHEVARSPREENLMAVLELWGKVLTCKVVV